MAPPVLRDEDTPAIAVNDDPSMGDPTMRVDKLGPDNPGAGLKVRDERLEPPGQRLSVVVEEDNDVASCLGGALIAGLCETEVLRVADHNVSVDRVAGAIINHDHLGRRGVRRDGVEA